MLNTKSLMTLKLQQQKQVEMSHYEVQGHTVGRNFSINGGHKLEVTQEQRLDCSNR